MTNDPKSGTPTASKGTAIPSYRRSGMASPRFPIVNGVVTTLKEIDDLRSRDPESVE